MPIETSRPEPVLTAWGKAHLSSVWLVMLVFGLGAGAALWVAGHPGAADVAWIVATAGGLVPMTVATVHNLVRRSFGVDVVALLAMAGCLALGEYLAGAVIAVMFASGQSLEAFAQHRARRELTALMGRSPHKAYRISGNDVVDISVDDVAVGDHLLVKSGDVLPVDGRISGASVVLDESALTGEARPVEHGDGDSVRSGTVNAAQPFHLIATSTAAQSTYSGIIRMVEQAQSSRAPLVRLADRYAVAFVGLTFALAAAAWLWSGEPVRALAVLVVATPCPLIIAAPVAIVSGVSRAARAGLIVKGGAVLESLGSLRVLLFDKTGTLTVGHPTVKSVVALPGLGEHDILQYAASLDQLSPHPLAAAIRKAGIEGGTTLLSPTDVIEEHGAGISGIVDGHAVQVGRAGYVGITHESQKWETRLRRRAVLESLATVFVGIDGRLAGAILLGDELRPDSARTVRALRDAGLRRIVMVTGDHLDIAEAIGAAVGLDAVMAEHAPDEKAAVVNAERAEFGPVAFVGDGINDAPALASADVGIAIGARGISAASETADAVLVVDRLDNLADAVRIAQRSRRIALQSIAVGMAMSGMAMAVAAFGLLTPVFGAVVQEGIDVVVILNALRALGGHRRRRPTHALSAMSAELRAEHVRLRGGIERLRDLADNLDALPPATARQRLEAAAEFLADEVLPHEAHEEQQFYPSIAHHIGGSDPTATMLRAHVEIGHLCRLFARAVESIGDVELDSTDILELRHLLYSLNAVLSLHNAQEDEAYISLVDSESHNTAELAMTGLRH